VAIPAQWWLSLELALLPNELIIGIQHDEVVDIRRRDEVLLSPGARIYTPSSKENDIGATDIGTVSISR
jgi:hypothetical protein